MCQGLEANIPPSNSDSQGQTLSWLVSHDYPIRLFNVAMEAMALVEIDDFPS